MRNRIDITGMIFGSWTAISHHRIGDWLCRCACGTEQIIRSGHLRGGRMTACATCRAAANDPALRFSRLYEKVASGCWEWTGLLHPKSGYGRFHSGRANGQSVSAYAHRFSYELHVGPITGRLQVLHRCDNRKCVNPEHLFLGTQQDNMRDMFAKGRNRAHGRVNLSASEVAAIRAVELTGEYGEVGRTARSFGITDAHFRSIRRGEVWKNISMETIDA